MSGNQEPVVVVGAGYVGLVTTAGLLERGHTVWCVDTDVDRLALLEKGSTPVFEPDLAEVLAAHRSHVAYCTDQREALEESGARVLISAVGTPPLEDGSADLSMVRCVVDRMPREDEVALVMKSTVPPGTGREIAGLASFPYVSCPEFLREGTAMQDVRAPDRVIIGCDDDSWAVDAVRGLHPTLPCERVFTTDVTNAELIKHASNFHLALRISYANQIANLCEALGADANAVLHGVGLDTRIGPKFLKPGLGFGGSCFAKDARALLAVARQTSTALTLASEILDVNSDQAQRVVAKLVHRLGPLAGAKVALLGLTFKPHTDDLRSSPAFTLARLLRSEGAVVCAWDPSSRARKQALRHGPDHAEGLATWELAASLPDAIDDAKAVILVTDWPELTEVDWAASKRPIPGALVLDGRNALDPSAVSSAGLTYEGTGRHSAGLPVWRPPTEGTNTD